LDGTADDARHPAICPGNAFRRGILHQFPLGSTSRVLLMDEAGHYAGMVPTAAAFAPALEDKSPVGDLAILKAAFLSPEDGIGEIMRRFEESEADDLAVVSSSGAVLGILTEKYVQRRCRPRAPRALRRRIECRNTFATLSSW
jgi:chloride channel protein, CIC family